MHLLYWKPILSLTLLLLTSSGLFAQKEIIDKVVATVGGELVLLSEIEERRALIQANQGTLPKNAECLILDNILSEKLLVNQAKLDSILVADEEVELQLDARIDQILAYMNNDVQQFEDYYGQTIAQVKSQFREDLRNQILAERMQGNIMANISATPSEVKTFFERIPQDSLPYFDSEVEIAEIVYKPKINKDERLKALAKAEELRERILIGGEDFAALASKFSDDFASARIGGDLGWTKRGKFVPEFEAAAYNLEEGEISEAVESEFGFHIIQLLERRGNSIHTRHILIKPQLTDADIELARRKMDTVRQLIVSDSISFEEAVRRYGDESVQSHSNSGRVVNPKTGNTFFEIADLEPDIFFAIDTLEVGGVSEPFQFTAQDGEKYFRLVQLQSRTSPHKATLERDYSKIMAAAIEEKKSRYLSEWINEKATATYIQVDPRYQICPNIAKWLSTEPRP